MLRPTALLTALARRGSGPLRRRRRLSATGSGGPGYATRDVPPGDASQLPPDYALLGKVVRGLEVAERIGTLGDPSSGELGTPRRAVVIERASVRAS